MAETIEKTKQYKYQVNANLVITRDNTGPRDAVHTTGESSTLSVYAYDTLRNQFGIGASRGRNEQIDEIKRKHRKDISKNQDSIDSNSMLSQSKFKKLTNFSSASVLDPDIDTTYKPTTDDSKAAYEAIIKFIEQKFGSIVC